MIVNKITVIYFFLLLLSLVVGLVGGGVALSSLLKWKKNISLEDRNAIEKKFYLGMAAIFLGVVIRLVMVPLWFYMLHKFIPIFPGAMCQAGIHQSVPVYSWIASGFKLLLPFLYFTWITLGIIDRKLSAQPFLKLRHFLLLPLALLLLVESYVDFKFISAIEPIPVSCCTALFDMGSDSLPAVFTESHWYFVVAFVGVSVALLIAVGVNRQKISFYWLTAFFSLAIFILLPLAHHTQLSPLLLETPFHHCIFCLLQNKPTILMGTILIFVGIYLSFSYSVVGLSAFMTGTDDICHLFIVKLRRLAVAVIATGLFVLTAASFYIVYFSGEF